MRQPIKVDYDSTGQVADMSVGAQESAQIQTSGQIKAFSILNDKVALSFIDGNQIVVEDLKS